MVDESSSFGCHVVGTLVVFDLVNCVSSLAGKSVGLSMQFCVKTMVFASCIGSTIFIICMQNATGLVYFGLFSKSYMYVSEVKYTGYVDSVCVCGGDSVI